MIRRAYQALGLLGWTGVLTLLAGALMQHFSPNLPSGYSWLAPYNTLRLIYGLEWTLAAVFAAFVIAELRRRSSTLFSSKGSALDGLKLIALGGSVALVDVVVFPSHNAADVGAVLCLTIVAARAPIGRERWRKLVGHVVVGAVVLGAICYCYSVAKALTLVNRVQVDGALAGFERAIVGEYPHRLVAAWASTKPAFVRFCDWVYFHFFLHMILTTVLLTGMRQRTERFEYLGALGFCYVIGGGLYHVLPAVGPAYFDADAYAYLNDLPLASNPVRAQLFHNTMDVLSGKADIVHTWGYVACMPSLHIAHELVMLYYARRSRLAFALSAAFSTATLIAVVVLGWHYFIDAVGGLFVAAISIAVARWQRDRLMPAALAPEPDEPLVARPLRGWLTELRDSVPAAPALDAARAKKIILALAAIALGARLVIGLRDLDATDRLFVPDDAYYTLGVARSLAHGVMPASGFSPLLAFLAVPAFWVTSNLSVPFVWVLVLSAVADAASVWLLGGIARRLGGPVAGALVAALWAASPLAIANALDGLETAIAFACQLAFVEAWLRAEEKKDLRTYLVAGVFAGLALLASVDSVFLVVAMGVVARRRIVPVAAAAAAVLAPWWIYALVRFGTILPESVAVVRAGLPAHHLTLAKQVVWMGGSLLGGSAADLPAVRVILSEHPALGVVVLLIVLAGFAFAVQKLRAPIILALAFPAGVLIVVYALYLPALGSFRRDLEPVYGVAALLLALAAAKARAAGGARRIAATLSLVVAAGFGLAAMGHVLRGLPDSPADGRGSNGAKGFGLAAKEVLAFVPDGAVLGSFHAGALTYFAPPGVRVVSLDGAVDRDARRAVEEQKVLDYAFAQHVTFVADFRSSIESLRFVSAKSPRGINAIPIGKAEAQGSERFTVYQVSWP